MMVSQPLSEREAQVLRQLVATYLATAEPVGSQAISDALGRRGIQVSSATVRSTLSDLDGAGLLEQPHPSAGRIPTREGLVHYVNCLMELKPLSTGDAHALKCCISPLTGDLITVLRETSKLISQISQYASLAVTPRMQDVIVEAPWGVIDSHESVSMAEVRQRLAILQEKTRLLEMMGGFQNVGKAGVMVGGGSESDPLQDCGMVTAPYAEDRQVRGCIGVMGPKRMDYARVVPIVESAAQYLGEWLKGQ